MHGHMNIKGLQKILYVFMSLKVELLATNFGVSDGCLKAENNK